MKTNEIIWLLIETILQKKCNRTKISWTKNMCQYIIVYLSKICLLPTHVIRKMPPSHPYDTSAFQSGQIHIIVFGNWQKRKIVLMCDLLLTIFNIISWLAVIVVGDKKVSVSETLLLNQTSLIWRYVDQIP